MRTPPGSLPDLSFLLQQTSHTLATEMTAALAELGTTPRSFCVLSSALAQEKTQTQLADECLLDKTTMVVTMDELERAGYAERHPAPQDRRARVIRVTEAGADLVEKGQRIVDRVHGSVLAALPVEQRDVFVNALTTLADDRLGTPPVCENAPRRRAPRAAPSQLVR